MSEFIDNQATRINALTDFARRLIMGENGIQLIEKHQKVIGTVAPHEAMQVLDNLLQEGIASEKVKANVGKIINTFHLSLSKHKWDKPADNHFLHFLMLENRAVEKIMTELKSETKKFFQNKTPNYQTQKLIQLIERLKAYELHYIKKENILFPHIEKAFPQYRCLTLMWSFHDDFRRSIKTIDALLQTSNPDKNVLNKELGKLFFVVFPLIFREEQIVFPVAYRAIPKNLWAEMLMESIELEWCYIDAPKLIGQSIKQPLNIDGKISLGTGFLKADQLILLLNNLPVDITFVDEDDEVAYFSGSKHRIFPRSNAIIGRKVQNCHPPESVHIVNEIVNAFRSGIKDNADFWIEMKGRFIHIRYFALRDVDGTYKGTIEVSQDVTEIRALKGEQRLLDWNL